MIFTSFLTAIFSSRSNALFLLSQIISAHFWILLTPPLFVSHFYTIMSAHLEHFRPSLPKVADVICKSPLISCLFYVSPRYILQCINILGIDWWVGCTRILGRVEIPTFTLGSGKNHSGNYTILHISVLTLNFHSGKY